MLAGASPWQEYIRENLRVARQNLPRHPFRIVGSEEFIRTMSALGEGGDMTHIPGVTDKRAGVITMQEFFGRNSHVPRFSGRRSTKRSIWFRTRRGEAGHNAARHRGILGEGLLEGLVECVTRDILTTQGIALARPALLAVGNECRSRGSYCAGLACPCWPAFSLEEIFNSS